MPRIRFTKTALDALQSADKEVVYWDTGLPGFGLKVTPKGRKVFIVLYRTGGAGSPLRKYTIGPYGRVTLHQARGEAQKVFAARLEGRDPAVEKREKRRRLATDRIEDLIAAFLAHRLNGSRSAKEVRRILEREAVSRWKGRSVHGITRRDVIQLIGEAEGRGAPYAASKLLKVLKTFFSWCVGRALLERSPADGIPAPVKTVTRDRILSDEELTAVLRAARAMEGPYGRIVEMLALTGQRREEVARMAWDELDLTTRTWTLPGSRTKNGRPHLVHLSEPALGLLHSTPRIGSFVFSASGAKPFQNFSGAKAELDAASGVQDWRLHDLRRTVVSGMARLGVAPHIADRILNHTGGTISGVAAVYQRYDFLAERKAALELWGTYVDRLLTRHQSLGGRQRRWQRERNHA
jgi:integrase